VLKIISAAALAAISLTTAAAQAPDMAALAAQRTATARFAWMDGRWRGPAVTRTSTGEHRVIQTERIGTALDGTIRVIEGKAFDADGSVGFHAFGIVSFDPRSQTYSLRSYAQGRSGDFPLRPTEDGYVWEIAAGPMTIRYTATLANGTWREIGERIVPGQLPQQFFEMNLVRIGDSDWPEAGAAGAP
jgi:hypothetical protein